MSANKATFKFNNGNGALLCSGCSVIIKTGFHMTEEEKSAMRGDTELCMQFCDTCKEAFSKINQQASVAS